MPNADDARALLLVALAGCTPPGWQEALEQAARDAEVPGATMVVVDGGEIVFSGATGLADLEQGTPMAPGDVVRLGSITKQLTAALILQLAQEGALSLDDPVSAHVPDFPKGDHIRLDHLGRHVSGLDDYRDLGAYTEEPMRWEVDELLALAYAQPLLGEPAASWDYANANYLLLGKAAEAVTGERWEDAIRDRIAAPLGLGLSFPEDGRAPIPGYAGGVDVSDHPHSENSWAAGAALGSTEDLALFVAGLLDGALLDDDHVAEMVAATPLLDGGQYDFGFGVGLDTDKRSGEYEIGHRGRAPGFSSAWGHRPARGVTIAISVNTDDVAGKDLLREVWAHLEAQDP